MAFSIDQRQQKYTPGTILKDNQTGKQYRVDNDGLNATIIDTPQYPIGVGTVDPYQQAHAGLAQSQALMDNAFKTPLQSIAEGDSSAGPERLKGAGKQLLSDFSAAGAQNAGPVGKAMLSNAPAFSANVNQFNSAMQPSNPQQALGAAETGIGSMLLPAQAAKSIPIVKSFLEARVATKAAKAEEQITKEALRIARPKITEEIEKQAAAEGRLGKRGFIKGAEMAPSAQETKLVEAVRPLVEEGTLKGKMDLSTQTDTLKQRVSQLNQGVRGLIADRSIPFNMNQFGKKLQQAKQNADLLFAGDKAQENAYDAVVNELVSNIKSKDTLGLFDARQDFDAIIKRKIPNAFKRDKTGSFIDVRDNARLHAVQDVRTAANHFVADQLDAQQVASVMKRIQPTEVKPLADKAKQFERPEDFIRDQQTNNLAEKLYAYGRDYKLKSSDLEEIWQMAHSNLTPTAGKVYTDMLRNETHLLQIVENLSTKAGGSTQRGWLPQLVKDYPKTAGFIGGATLLGGLGTAKEATAATD